MMKRQNSSDGQNNILVAASLSKGSRNNGMESTLRGRFVGVIKVPRSMRVILSPARKNDTKTGEAEPLFARTRQDQAAEMEHVLIFVCGRHWSVSFSQYSRKTHSSSAIFRQSCLPTAYSCHKRTWCSRTHPSFLLVHCFFRLVDRFQDRG